MKILLIGKNGQVGWELQRTLAPLGEIIAIDFPDINLADEAHTRLWVQRTAPQVIVNAAAYTAVDEAESEAEIAMAVNGTAPGVLAEAARALDAILIHFSSDYVFDGTKGEAYIESDATSPLNVYGLSKLAGDQNIQQIDGDYLILRTTWVYSMRQGGFVRKVLEWARNYKELRIVSDQIGSPTWARALAEVTAQVLAKSGRNPSAWISERKGLYHLGGRGSVSRYHWAQKILEFDPNPEEQVVHDLIPTITGEFPTPAKRPLFTPVDCKMFYDTFGICLPDWDVALQLAMEKFH
jgi:dTDP-4-dehydrorhamnose reductase